MATKQQLTGLKVAIVHDWLTNLGGAERVVLAISQAFPDAPIYTSVYERSRLPQFADKKVITSYLQHWPLSSHHQLYPLLRMRAFESFDFSDYDIVISSSSAEAKSIITSTQTLHLSYIHTPIRYYWSGYQDYLANPGLGIFNPLARMLLPTLVKRMRRLDFASAQRPDAIMANSKNVQARIKKYYQRPSQVLHPPVDLSRFDVKKATDGDYFLIVSRLIPYKRVDIAIEAFSRLNQRLIVVGSGSQYDSLRKSAGPNIEFKGQLDDRTTAKLYLGARALIFTAEEDFGITPVEAMACGKPVICYSRGGAIESVVNKKTGLYFNQQTSTSLAEAIKQFEGMSFDSKKIRRRAEHFSTENFISQLKAIVSQKYEEISQ